MTYAEDRLVYDADSHVMELPGWLNQYADATTIEQLRPISIWILDPCRAGVQHRDVGNSRVVGGRHFIGQRIRTVRIPIRPIRRRCSETR